MRRAVLYLRVSTIDQTTANQERELREIAGRMGCEIVKVYKDHGISGAKGRGRCLERILGFAAADLAHLRTPTQIRAILVLPKGQRQQPWRPHRRGCSLHDAADDSAVHSVGRERLL